MFAVLCAVNAKYVHASLAPWCLLAGVRKYAPQLTACVAEGTVNEPVDTVLARIEQHSPRVVGFSCYIWNIEYTLTLCQRLRQRLPDVRIVLGGPEVSFCAQQVLARSPWVDWVLSGEGEASLPALLQLVAQGKAPRAHEIAGLCTRTEASAPQLPPVPLPSPYSQEYLQALNGRIAYLETSRGCPFSCAFCLSGRCGAPRWFPLEQSLEHLTLLANSGAKTIKFIDRTFNANAAHANAILRFILQHYGTKLPRGVCFHFEIAGDILTEETMQLLGSMPPGAVQLEIGMQSFCEKALAAVRRKTDTTRLVRNIRRLVSFGCLHIHLDLIAGLPHEDLQAFAHSFNTAWSLGADVLQMGFLKLLHGAPMREEPERFACEYSQSPPYEVVSTPWLSQEDLTLLHHTEDALERMVNSGRFLHTVRYMLSAGGLSAFALFSAVGTKAARAGVAAPGTSLDSYTAFLYDALPSLSAQCDRQLLRDAMVRDRLTSNVTGRLPKCLNIRDPLLKQQVKLLSKKRPPPKGVRRGAALLYGVRRLVFVDYETPCPRTGRYPLQELPFLQSEEKGIDKHPQQ